MEGYLGSTPVDVSETPFANYTATDWAMYFIGSYGQIDGAHHKLWVLDQVARILRGTPVEVSKREWAPNDRYPEGLVEYEPSTGEPSPEYLAWVAEMKGDYDEDEGEHEYGYDEGIAP